MKEKGSWRGQREREKESEGLIIIGEMFVALQNLFSISLNRTCWNVVAMFRLRRSFRLLYFAITILLIEKSTKENMDAKKIHNDWKWILRQFCNQQQKVKYDDKSVYSPSLKMPMVHSFRSFAQYVQLRRPTTWNIFHFIEVHRNASFLQKGPSQRKQTNNIITNHSEVAEPTW